MKRSGRFGKKCVAESGVYRTDCTFRQNFRIELLHHFRNLFLVGLNSGTFRNLEIQTFLGDEFVLAVQSQQVNVFFYFGNWSGPMESRKCLLYPAGCSAFLAPCKLDRSKYVTNSSTEQSHSKISQNFQILFIIPSSPALHKETCLTLSFFLKKA